MLAIQFSCLIGLWSRYTCNWEDRIIDRNVCTPPQHSRASDSIYTLQPVIEAQYVKKREMKRVTLWRKGERSTHSAVQYSHWVDGQKVCVSVMQPVHSQLYVTLMTCLWGSCHVSIQLYSDTIHVTRIEIAAVGHLVWWWFLSKQRFVNLNDSSNERIWFWVQCVPFSLGASCYCISTLVQNEEIIKSTQRSSSSYGVPIINGLLKFRVTVNVKSKFIFLKSISNYSPLITHIFSSEAWIATFYVSVCHRFDYTTEMWLAEDHLEWTGWLGCVE